MNFTGSISSKPVTNGSLLSSSSSPANFNSQNTTMSQQTSATDMSTPGRDFSMSHRSSVGSEISSTPTKKRQLSRLERENPDIDPAILAVIDPTKPIREQIGAIKAAEKALKGHSSRPETPVKNDAPGNSTNDSKRFDASQSVRSYASSSTSMGGKQTSGLFGQGNHPAVEHMRKKAAEDRIRRRYSQSRTSYAGSMISNNDLNTSRVSNSTYGMSRIGLHSSSGSVRQLQSVKPPANPPVVEHEASPMEKFQSLSYVQSVLARKDTSQSSRASTPADTKLESPLNSIIAKARGALVENTKEIQAARAEKRRQEAREEEARRERERRDARLEWLAKVAKEEEESLARQTEELVRASANRKRDATGSLRYSPEMKVNNSIHPYGNSDAGKSLLKRGYSPSTTSLEQITKRNRSSEPDEEMSGTSPSGSSRPIDSKPTDSKLMPPPPTPTPRTASQTSNGALSRLETQQSSPPLSEEEIWAALEAKRLTESLSHQDDFFGPPDDRHSAEQSATGNLSFISTSPENIHDSFAYVDHYTADGLEGEGQELVHSEEPEIGRPLRAAAQTWEEIGALPIVRDFAYPSQGSMFSGGPEESDRKVYSLTVDYGHCGSDTDEDEDDDDDDDDDDEEGDEDEGYNEKEEEKGPLDVNNEPVVIDLLDSGSDEGDESEVENDDGDEEIDEEDDYDDEEEGESDGEGYDEERSEREEGSENAEDDDDDIYFDENVEVYDEGEEEMYRERAEAAARARASAEIVEVPSSPVLAVSQSEAANTQSGSPQMIIPDSFASKDEETPSADGPSDNKDQEAASNNYQEEAPAEEAASSFNHDASQESHWVRSMDGRLTRSNSPDAIVENSQEEGSEGPADIDDDEKMGEVGLQIDPDLLKPIVSSEPSAPAATHTH
ncbi:hypothetical protein ABW19_dt0202037 [Dactylella cylindrospora]|nr:hypothetical protein ABW19_dt0202037 [Dactylella cylindrospora]